MRGSSPSAAPPSAQSLFEEEFVPLAVAARIAYGFIGGSRAEPNDDDLQLVGIALSTVAPLWRETAAGGGVVRMSAQDIETMLFVPLRREGGEPRLDGLCLRRGDLRRGMMALREARIAAL